MRKRIHLPILSNPQYKRLESLYSDYGDLVYIIAMKLLQDKYLAEDAEQETFVRAIKNIEKINIDNVPATKKYLEIICRNVAMDMLRLRGKAALRELSVDDDERDSLQDLGPGPPEILLKRELIDKIKQEVLRLKPIYQDVFLMKAVYDHSTDEVAAILNISAETVRKRYNRARAILAERLEEYLHE